MTKKKIMFIGRSGAGKTTLTQALSGVDLQYQKTQYVNYHEYIIDPPGEYIEDKQFGFALALYSYEVDAVGFLIAANEPFSLYSPFCTALTNREVVGIVTQINHPDANPALAAQWLRLAGCERIFFIDSVTREGLDGLDGLIAFLTGEKPEKCGKLTASGGKETKKTTKTNK